MRSRLQTKHRFFSDAAAHVRVLTRSARSDDEETAALDAEKLRVYERERLRFYYAIVECDSAATAAALYKQCDGLVRRFRHTAGFAALTACTVFAPVPGV